MNTSLLLNKTRKAAAGLAAPAPRTNAAPSPIWADLESLARNLQWAWTPQAPALFAELDQDLWQECEHNPVRLLQQLKPARRRALESDRVLRTRVSGLRRRMKNYLAAATWFERQPGAPAAGHVAYFSMEFGLHESMPIFAGGLGVLAGDHLKSASDLGLPLLGVGMFWREGYTRQVINAVGTQSDRFDRRRPDELPIRLVTDRSGKPLRISVPVNSDTVVAQAWRLDVGRLPLFLLDTHLPENPPRHRKLTDRLYSGDRDTRIRQEMVLGIGGWRLLRELKLPVTVCHLNEGHAAFCAVERMAALIEGEGLDFTAAARRVAETTVFTTHTPVADGNETFDPALVARYLRRYVEKLGLDFAEFASLGRIDPTDATEPFGMTPLALRLSAYRNGVSRLHGQVSRAMWHGLWPSRPVDKVPIGSITNGIHVRTWMHPKMGELLDEFLPEGWEEQQDRRGTWAAARRIPDERLWSLHQELKRDLIDFVVRRAATDRNGSRRALPPPTINLDPEALTIGFARRFAAYKRANLIFHDLGRAERLISRADRPVQIIFAGKAHPADQAGKALVAQVVAAAASPRFRGRVVFIEDYDMAAARHLVSGVDVWLNNPRRPEEASGTSGMKPTLHGGLNLSILDGWWPEACSDGANGWAIGEGLDHDGTARADRRDARCLYHRLEQDVVPLYYRRDCGGLPRDWLRHMKESLAAIPAVFNSHRMVKEYWRRYYAPALRKG